MKYFLSSILPLLFCVSLYAQPPGFNYTTQACAGDAFGLLGVIQINGVTPSNGSWIAIFDETNILAGSSLLNISGGIAYIPITQVNTDENVPPAAPNCAMVDAGINGYPGNPEKFFLVVWNAADMKYYQFPNDGMRTLYDFIPQSPYIQGFTNFNTVYNLTGNGYPTLPELFNMMLLPIELLYFRGAPKDADVLLEWATASEQNNDFFEVQRSTNGRDFEVLGKVPGAGTYSGLLTYDFTDRHPKSEVNYYRLRQVDFDGAFEYSPVVSVKAESKERDMALYPNPAGEYMEVSLPAEWSESETELILRDISGRVLRRVQFSNVDGLMRISTEDLPGGYYTLQASNGRELLSERVVVIGENR
ncbi:MAG: T9SS type A sorting domain-containing protein [Saprospiraceae bacterium]|nr:T9SS type A sorting domain-containing protein [Saprospiraceae bacterium]